MCSRVHAPAGVADFAPFAEALWSKPAHHARGNPAGGGLRRDGCWMLNNRQLPTLMGSLNEAV